MTPDTRLRSCQRIRSTVLFQETYAQDKSWRGRLMVLFLRRGAGAGLRVGVVASHAAVGGAVQRNRCRRRLREAFRRLRHQFRPDVDVVLIARRNLLNAPWDAVTGELLYLARKSGLMAGGAAGGSPSRGC